ncbi:MAG: site-2 protease family protein [Polyangiaceae bacterium]|nr:site-2 protease family protein [Polyangiaceae bacterium]
MGDPATGRLDAGPASHPGWRANAGLFVLTVASVFVTTFFFERSAGEPTAAAAREAGQFTAALLAILVAHESGHYVAARLHRVEASLPYFIPLPLLSPFGTMGAVIRMRSSIPTRRALFDIGAAGPLAGLALAIPLYAWGAAHSTIVSADGGDGVQLGSSLLLRALDRAFAPAVPEGRDLMLSPIAYGAWVGMFITMINLLPAGQLDGGHVAYALLGERQNRVARWAHRSMLAFFFVNVASFAARDIRSGFGLWHLGRHVYNSVFWIVWFEVLAVIGSVARPARRAGEQRDSVPLATRAVVTLGIAVVGWALYEHSSVLLWAAFAAGLALLMTLEVRWGSLRASSGALDHPPTDGPPLSGARAALAVLTLALFALLVMPTPFVF